MANTKNYGIGGIAASVQYGKKGGNLRYVVDAPDGNAGAAPAFQVRNSTNTALLRLQGGSPLQNDDLTTKLYVDNLVQGLDLKGSVRLASNGENVALTGATPLVLDATNAANGDRVLLKNQTDGKQNGIYTVAISGSTYTLTRATDADNKSNTNAASSEVTGGMFTFVEEGTQQADTGWVLSAPNGLAVLGTDSLVFAQFSSAGVVQPGIALSKTGNIVDVKFDGVTVYPNANNQLAVKSSATAGQVLVSQGSGTAVWGGISLSNTTVFGTSVLPSTNGGTGINTYAVGDLLLGDVNNTLSKLSKGASSTVLGVDANGAQGYRFLGRLHDANGNLMLGNTTASGAVNYFNISNSAASADLVLSTAGTGTDLNIQLAPKGNGIITAKAGYDAYLSANRASITNEALVTKGLLDARVASIDTSRIQNSAGDTFVATSQTGFVNKTIVASNSKVIAEFVGATATGVAVLGERMRVTHTTDEVQLGVVNSAGTGNVNLRLLPQQQGQVFIGATGAGLIQGEDSYQLTLKGGNNTSTQDAGNLVLRGGDSSTGNFNAGNVRIFAGTNSGTGTRGSVRIEDDRQVIIANFRSPVNPAANWFEFENSSNDPDPLISALKIRASLSSANGDVSILLDPKGSGLVRVADENTYSAALASAGQMDALVTKSFVSNLVSGTTRQPAVGLSQTDATLNVNVGANTIKVDGSNNLIVNSTNVANQVLLSSGSVGFEAAYGALPLANSNSVTGTLSVNNGGTGLTSYTANDLVIGNAGGSLSKLAKGANNQVLQINASGNLAWGFQTILRDGNGLPALQSVGVANAANYATVKNAAQSGAVEIGTDGTDSNITIVLNPKGNGLVVGRTGYTTSIGANRETFITKGYVDDSLQSNTDPLVRRQSISSGWQGVMPISVPTPNISGRAVYLHRASMNVITAVSGGGVVSARIVAGLNEVMNADENDISIANAYVTDLPFSFTSSNSQINIEFYQADGVTPAVPTAGSLLVTVEYKII